MCVGEADELAVDVSQASALSHCLFAVVIDVITGEVRKEPYWTVTFANDMFFLSRMRSHDILNIELERCSCWKEGI